MASGSKGRSALTTAGTADCWGLTSGTAGTEDSCGLTAGISDGWGLTAGTAGIGAGIGI